MPSASRRFVYLLPLLVAMQAVSTDTYLPALPAIVAGLGTTIAQVQLTLSVFLVTFGVTQLAYGPLSDRFGRRPLLLGGTALYTIASLACALAPSIEVLILCRALQAMGACSGTVLGRAVVRDTYAPTDAARVLALLGAAMALAPAIGPILGGTLAVNFGWRSTFVGLAIFGGLALAGVAWLVPETNKQRDPTATQAGVLWRNYTELLTSRPFLAATGIAAGGYAGIFTFISGSSYLLIEEVGLTPRAYGFCFGAVALGYMAGSLIAARLGRRLGLDGLLTTGTAICLAAAMLGLLGALALPPSVPSIVLPYVLYLFGTGFGLPAAMATAVAPYPTRAGLASALLGCLQLAVASAVGVGVSLAYDGTPLPMMAALTFAASLAVASRRARGRVAQGAASAVSAAV